MKPYLKVIVNMIRMKKKKLLNGVVLENQGFQLFNYNTKMHFMRGSKVYLGDRIISDGRMVLIVDRCGELRIGARVYFNEGMMISCKSKVEIGEGCQFGPNVKIFDNNHCFNAQEGVLSAHNVGDVKIGNNCWIASNVTILKDSNIGDNCVIGAGCVIKGIIPAKSIVTQTNELSIKPIL